MLATEKVASAPTLDTVKIVVLSIAQQDGRTRTIVAKATVSSSVAAAIVALAVAPGIAVEPFSS
jgi:hypothetical protein